MSDGNKGNVFHVWMSHTLIALFNRHFVRNCLPAMTYFSLWINIC